MRRNTTIIAGVMFVALATGCASGKAQIGKAASLIRGEATATKADLDGAIGTGEVGPLATPFIEAASARQDTILSLTERVNQALGSVEDKTPYWGVMLGRGLWVLGALAIIVLLIYFLPLIRPIMAGLARMIPWAFAWVIPAPTRTEAEMDAKTIRSQRIDDQRQVRRIEARKQTDPMYRAAFDIEMQQEETP
jgi:hypothetical protein